MKYTKALLLAVFCMAVTSVAAQEKNADTIINKMFTALKNKDEKAYTQLFPDQEEFSRFLHFVMTESMKSEEFKKSMTEDASLSKADIDSMIKAQMELFTGPEMYAEVAKGIKKSFAKAIKKGEDKGVVWSDAKLISYTIDSSSNAEEFKQVPGIKNMKGVIEFTSSGQPYQMVFDEIMYLPEEKAWFGAGIKQIVRKGESLQTDDPLIEEVIEDEIMEKKPVDKKPVKTTTKPATSTKPASKTPAKKPSGKTKTKS